MEKRSYVREFNKFSREELFHLYEKEPLLRTSGSHRRYAFLNNIGIAAVVERCQESTGILLNELENGIESDGRMIAAGFLGDLPKEHPLLRRSFKAAKKALKKENNENIKKQLQASLYKLEKRARI